MKNQVFQKTFKPYTNFFEQDKSLSHLYHRLFTEQAREEMLPRWRRTGQLAATDMNRLSLLADQHPPKLIPRTFLGEDQPRIEFHPAYEQLLEIAVQTGMFSIKWAPEHRQRFAQQRHALGFSAGFIFAMSESSLYCPLCMTDGAARLLDLFADPSDQARLLPHIYTESAQDLYTGAMFLTEKSGGSDVGANLVRAEQEQGPWYRLYGEKWFCSNANAQIIFALARTNPQAGTRGLGIFLVEPQPASPWRVLRLKDKLGVRSMASAECLFEGQLGKLIGAADQGFKIMTEMINLSRLYNAVAAVAAHRHGLIEAYQFLQHRQTFGQDALNHALIRKKIHQLLAVYYGNFYLTWRCIQALDAADNGHQQEKEILRVLTPLLKRCTAEQAVYGLRESMELMGGLGYIEDGIMPKLLRDCLVLPIWEGAGNIMILDMLRASLKSQGLSLWLEELHNCFAQAPDAQCFAEQTAALQAAWPSLQTLSGEELELQALPFFEALTRLSQVRALYHYRDEESAAWIDLALAYFRNPQAWQAPSRAAIQEMMAMKDG